jgi:hypothetical protein
MTTQLTVSQLFAPAPSGVGPYGTIGGAVVGAVPQTPGTGTWFSVLLNIATTVQLPTTSWQVGDPERTIFAAESVCFSLSDACISQMAQGGFLQSAASGTVTWTSPAGVTVTTPVTPDPSNAAQNPTGAPGYEDLLAKNVYNVERLAATYVTGPLAIVKLSGGTLSFAAGAYHVQSTLGPATYANRGAALSIPSSAIGAGGGVIMLVTTGVSATVIATQAAHGLTPGQTVYVLLPSNSGVTGLSSGPGGGCFALVVAVTSTSFQIAVGSSGAFSGPTVAPYGVYLCTVATMTADVVGIGSNAGPGTVTTAITQQANVFVSNVVGWSGSNWESNLALAGRCQLSLASRSPNGPHDAYVYFAETAYQLLALAPYNLSPPLTNGPVRAAAFSIPATGIVNVVVASANPISTTLGDPVTPGCSQLPISGITNANPAVITCTGPTSLSPGGSMTVTISGVLGMAGVNGTFLGTYVASNSFSIPIDTTSAGAYAGGGTVEGGDLGQIDRLIQQNVVPNNTTAIMASALALPIQVTAIVSVPTANVATYQIASVQQLQAQTVSYPIGGDAADGFQVSWDDIAGALSAAGVPALGQASYAHVQSLVINGTVSASGQGVAFPSAFYEALLVNPLVTVVGT